MVNMVLTNSERHPRDHQDLVLHGLWVVHLVHQTITILSLFFFFFALFLRFLFFLWVVHLAHCTIPIIFSVFSFFAGWTPIVSNHHNPFWFKSVSPDISSCGSQGARGKGLWSRAPGKNRKTGECQLFSTHLVCLAFCNDFVKANNLAVEDGDAVKGLGHHGGRVLPLLHLWWHQVRSGWKVFIG